MTKKKRKVVGRIDKVVAIRGLLDCRILEPVSLARGVLEVVGRLLKVPRGVVFLLVWKDWFWEKGENPVEIDELQSPCCKLLDGVQTGLVRGQFIVDLV